MQFLNDRYSKHNSLYTTCIETKPKPKILKVRSERITKPFQLIHTDVCWPFSTPTSTNHRQYLLFIDHDTRYTSILVLPDRKRIICTSVYQLFQAQVDCIGYEVRKCWYDNGHGEYNNKTFQQVVAARHTIQKPDIHYPHPRIGAAETPDPHYHPDHTINGVWLPDATCVSQRCNL